MNLENADFDRAIRAVEEALSERERRTLERAGITAADFNDLSELAKKLVGFKPRASLACFEIAVKYAKVFGKARNGPKDRGLTSVQAYLKNYLGVKEHCDAINLKDTDYGNNRKAAKKLRRAETAVQVQMALLVIQQHAE